MNRKQRQLDFWLLRGLLLCLVGVVFIHWSAGNGESQETKHVLVLYSQQTSVPVQEEVNQGLRAALQATKHPAVSIEIEFLDIERFAEPAYQNELLNLLRRKYAHRRLDVIIPVFHPAVKFLLQYGELIFKDVPVVFAAELQPFLQDLTLRPNMTGAYAAPDIAPNLKMALGLVPQTRKVVVVGGVLGSDRIYQSWIREAFAPFADRVELTYLTDHTLEELQERLAHLPPHSIIFFITFDKDPTGREFLSTEALKLMARAANAPIFGFYDTLLGEGIVGGSLISFQEQGRLAGELAVRILKGEKPENLPPVLAGNPLLFDWRQLKRWGIAEDKLPPDSMVSYREHTLWELYRGWIIGFLVFLGLQSGLIGALLINRAKRSRAEQGLAERLRFEEVLSELSAAFINFSGDQAAQEIDTCLNRVLTSLKIDRISVMEFSDDEDQLKTRHFSTAPGIPGISLYIPTEEVPWFFRNISEGKSLMYSRLPDDLPSEAIQEKEYCRQEGLKSIISLPLQAADSVLGVINFSTLQEHVDWSRYPLPRLHLVAEIFANAIMRQKAAASLQEHEQSYRIVADFTYDWEYWENPDGSLRYISPACERISGYPAEEFLSRPQLVREIIVPEDRQLWDDHQEGIRQAAGHHEIQFRLQRADDDIRWIEHVCQPVHGSRGEFLGFRASNRDITARKQTEIQEQQHREELARVGRMAILSELTGSLAHEIIQPLMAIMTNSQAARRLLDDPDPDVGEVKETLEDITRGSERASNVIQQLRQHLKPGPPEFARLNLSDLVQNLIPLVSRQAAINNINLVCELTKDLPPIAGNRIQLEQVMLNLVVNAIEAIKGSADGPREIVLQTAREDADTLRVSVMDSGCGVKPEELKLLFDPFFTTKKEGLGLGLSISRSIIKAHKGRLWAAPNPGRGTSLHFTLPVSQENQ